MIIFSTIVDYTIGRLLHTEKNQTKRKAFLLTSILINIGLLGFFKYYNFFLENFINVFSFFGTKIKPNSLNIILPVGISFYTFQTMSYTIDVYKKKLEPTKDFIAFTAFVCFFPQLVAGPIERAINLLPQFYKKRSFNYIQAVDGMRQLTWGLFKKVIIADNCAIIANDIFANYDNYSGNTLIIGAIMFTFQIYGDFSGYSDIAIGTSRLFGFNLMQNFAFPYFSRDIAEFWRRWHISLTTWFRDYVYIPIGGSRGNIWMKIRNTFIIFLVSGFWHGAKWTFIVWGLLNAIYFLPLLLTKRNRTNINIVAKDRWLPNLKEFIQMITTFSLTVFAWIFFRAESLVHAFKYIKHIIIDNYLKHPGQIILLPKQFITHNMFPLLAVLLFMEWVHRKEQYGFSKIDIIRFTPLRWSIYALILLYTLFSISYINQQEFVYFQF